jgi:diaminopimelate decarboxylase
LFNISPQPPRPEHCPSIEAFGQALTDTVRDRCPRYGIARPSLLFQPGRILTGDCQVLLVSIKELTPRAKRSTYAITDGGMQNIPARL